MTHQLRYIYDERDFLEVWLPEAETNRIGKREPGLYKVGVCARTPGSCRAFDSFMLEAFSKAYPLVLAEVLAKEPSRQQENYEVPELGLYGVLLSQVLREIHNRIIAKAPLVHCYINF